MSTRAFAFITSHSVMVRTLASLRSLDAVGALSGAVANVLCLDNSSYQILSHTTAREKVKLLRVADLPEIAPFASRPISRFAVTCKPYLLRWSLTEGGADQALYFDSDIWFVSDPSFLFDRLDQDAILLVPSIINPEATINDWKRFAKNAQRTGYYNAGFVGTSRAGMDFLNWWANRCAYSTFRNFYEDISGDQKYLSWVPSLFDHVGVVRHYGMNIKPWLTRYVSLTRQTDGKAAIHNDPLVYFHFSQDLGNLLIWPEEFYSEVSDYLAALEQARLDCGEPYVDMPRRDNSDLDRPLLPRYGKLAVAIRLLANWREPVRSMKHALSETAGQIVSRLPRSIRAKYAQRYLRYWKLDGDTRLLEFEPMLNRIGKGPVVFLGASRLAFYLAYLGRSVHLYEPFQGHYNAELKKLFNPQWRDAEKMRSRLLLNGELDLARVPLVEARVVADAETVVIAARRTSDEIAEIFSDLNKIHEIKQVVTLFDPAWPAEYRDRYRKCIEHVLEDKPVQMEQHESFDWYGLGRK